MKRKNIIIWALCTGLFLVVAAATFVALYFIVGPTETTPRDVKNIESKVTIDTYRKSVETRTDAQKLTISQDGVKTPTPIFIQSTSKPYLIQTLTKKYVKIQGIPQLTDATFSELSANAKKFLTDTKYSLVSTNGIDIDGLIAIYHNNGSTCNILGATIQNQLSVVCENESSTRKLTETTSSLLEEWGGNESFKYIRPTFVENSAKGHSLASLVVFGDSNQLLKSLVFTKIANNDWQYAGDITPGQGQNSGGGKVAQNEAFESLANDQNFGPLLTKALSDSSATGVK